MLVNRRHNVADVQPSSSRYKGTHTHSRCSSRVSCVRDVLDGKMKKNTSDGHCTYRCTECRAMRRQNLVRTFDERRNSTRRPYYELYAHCFRENVAQLVVKSVQLTNIICRNRKQAYFGSCASRSRKEMILCAQQTHTHIHTQYRQAYSRRVCGQSEQRLEDISRRIDP